MNLYKQIRTLWKKPKSASGYKDFLIELRKHNSIERVEKPVRLDRARSLGYKAKPGFITVRVGISKGGRRKRSLHGGGRKPSKTARTGHSTNQSLQVIAEQRAARKYVNLEVLNSYLIGEDGKRKWFEIIMIDPKSPSIIKDAQVSRIINQKRRAFRGLTSAGKKSRGLLNKGKGAERIRRKKVIYKRTIRSPATQK